MMLFLATVILLSAGLSNVGAIDCNTCMEVSSTSPTLQALLSAGAAAGGAEGVTGMPPVVSCETPVTMSCPNKCQAQQFIFTFTSETYGDGTATMTQLACSDQGTESLPLGADNCVSPEFIAVMAGQVTAGVLPPGITVTDTTGSLCLCDTANCNEAPAAAASNPSTAAPPMMGSSAEPQAGDGADKDTTMETTTAGAVHILASAAVLIGSLLSAVVFRAV